MKLKTTGQGKATGKKPEEPAAVYARPTPKVLRGKRGKTFTAEERAAFLATRPDLK